MLEAIGIVVAIVTGVAGLVVSLLTYISQRDATRPRIRVRPRMISIVDRTSGTSDDNICVIEICNVGNVPVIGSMVGFSPRGKGKGSRIVVTPDSITGIPWGGNELKPGQLSVLRMSPPSDPESLGLAFATTLVGDMFECTRKEMKAFRTELMRSRKRISRRALRSGKSQR